MDGCHVNTILLFDLTQIVMSHPLDELVC